MQILVVDVVQETYEIRIIDVKVQVIEVDSSRSDQRIIRVVNNHEDLTNYFSVVYFASIGGVGSESEGFGSNRGSDVNIDLSAEFAKRQYVLLEFSNCQFSTHFSSPLSWYPADIMYRVIESVRLEQRTVLLSVYSFNSGLNIVNSSGLDNLPAQLDMVADKRAVLALLILSDNLIVQDGAVEPCAFIDADIS